MSSGTDVRGDDDWTSSPRRYSGMNAGPTYDPFEEDRQLGDAINERVVKPTLEAYAKAKSTVYDANEAVADSMRYITARYGNVTLDSGERQEFPSGMKRDTSKGKVEWALIIPEVNYSPPMVQRWAELMTRGAEKYSRRNWELASSDEEYQRFMDSAFRHFMQWYLGETDEDHAAAVFFNIQGAEYVKAKVEHAE